MSCGAVLDYIILNKMSDICFIHTIYLDSDAASTPSNMVILFYFVISDYFFKSVF